MQKTTTKTPYEPLQFDWPVSQGGYTWIQATAAGDKQPGWFLVESDPRAKRHRYQPLVHETGLFKTFAELGTSRGAIVEFANKYGLLGMPRHLKDGKAKRGESIEQWRAEIREMQGFIDLLDLARRNDTAELSKRFRIVEKHKLGKGIWYGSVPVAFDRDWPDLVIRFQQGERTEAALWHLQSIANKKLRDFAVTAQVLHQRKQGGLGLYFWPSNLLSCMWLQAAKNLTGDRDYRRCETCGKWFEVAAPVHRAGRQSRSDKRNCSPTCRGRAFRARHANKGKKKAGKKRRARR